MSDEPTEGLVLSGTGGVWRVERNDRYEFQMLYGVRRDLQESLVKEGYRVRCYVPFGTQWYPYLMRRLAERPANVMFITGSVVREALHRDK